MKALLLALLLASPALRAQQDPTPFWMPAPEAPEKAKKKKPVQVEPLEIKRKKLPPAAEKRRAPLETRPTREERRAEKQRAAEEEKEEKKQRAAEEKQRAAEERRKPVGRPPPPAPAAPYEPSWIEPSQRGGRQEEGAQPEPPTSPTAKKKQKKRGPVDPEGATAAPRKPVAPLPPVEQGAPSGVAPRVLASPAPQPEPVAVLEEPPARPDFARWSLQLAFGAWAKARSDGGGRSVDPAYGLRVGRAFLDGRVEADLAVLRSGGNAGSPYVSASATHNLAALRAFYVLGGPRLSALLGAGGGAVLTQSHYALLDVTVPGAVPTGLDSTSPRGVIELTAAARARPVRGLEARLEVSAVVRDGRLEWLPLLGLGAAF